MEKCHLKGEWKMKKFKYIICMLLLIFATPNESGTDGSAQPPFSTDGM